MKKNKNFWFYSAARFISSTGTAMQSMAIPLYILDLTGSGTLMGMFSIFLFLPLAISAPFSGIIGDMKNRKNIMIISDLVRFALILTLSLLAGNITLNVYILFAFQTAISVMDSFFNSSSGAIMPEIVSKSEYLEACSIRGTIDGLTSLIGPVIGGMLYGLFGIKIIFLINSISFLLSAVSLLFIKYNHISIKKHTISIHSFVSDNIEGLSFIKNNKGIFQLTIFALIANCVLSPYFDIILPYVLKKVIGFSAQQYGYIAGFITLGMIICNIAISLYFKNWSTGRLIRLGLGAVPPICIIISMALYPSFVKSLGGASWTLFSILAVLTAVFGFLNALSNTPISTNIQKLVPNYIRSRYNAIAGMFSLGAIPLGSFLFGLLLDRLPYFYIMIGTSIAILIIYAVFLTTSCDDAFEPKTEEKSLSA